MDTTDTLGARPVKRDVGFGPKSKASIALLESLRRNAARKSELDADKGLLIKAADEIERLQKLLENPTWDFNYSDWCSTRLAPTNYGEK